MTPSLAREAGIEPRHIKWIWIGVFIVVGVLAGGMTQWELLAHLLENEGVGEEGASLLAFVAGYTLPLTTGAAVLSLILLRGGFQQKPPMGVALVVAVILWVSGALAAGWGLGLLPAYDESPQDIGGHPAIGFLVWVLRGYFNTHGWPLMLSSLSIGFAIAIQIDAWMSESE